MKKLSIFLLSMVCAITLSGCGNAVDDNKDSNKNKDVITTKTCTVSEEGFLTEDIVFSATNGKVDKFNIVMTYDNSLFGVDSFAELSEEEKEAMKSEMLSELDSEDYSFEGVDIKVDINDQVVMTMIVDLNKADRELLDEIGFDFSEFDGMSLDEIAAQLTEVGATCK